MSKEVAQLKEQIQELERELTLKNAEVLRYRQELAKANNQLEKMIVQVGQELRSAQALQKFLSPTELPHIPGFEFSTKFLPGTRFGGDYFDIFEHEDKLKFGVLMACSSGYAMSALLLSVIIKVSSQIEARKGLSPEKVIELLAKEVVPHIQGTDSASLFYAVVDRRSYDVDFASAGDIKAYLLVQGKDALTELKATGPALRKDVQLSLQKGTFSMSSKDRLVVASEGVTKAVNSQGVAWGSWGLEEAMGRAPKTGVHELRNEILIANERFSGKEDPLKDQTVLVLEVKDRVIKLAKQ